MSKRSRDRQRASVQATQTAQASHAMQANLALLRDALAMLAGEERIDPVAAAAQAHAIDETRDALATLERLAPTTLALQPELLDSARRVVEQAEARTQALADLPPETRRQLQALSTVPDLVRTSPTQSTPVASGETAHVALAGMGGKRTTAMGVPNAEYLRRLATRNPWVQAAITHRKQQVGRADIAVMPLDETRPWNRLAQSSIERLLNYPNELRDSYRSLIEPVIDDILTLDRGCISKDLDARGIPHHLYYEDGATIKIIADWNGDPSQPHYVYQPPNTTDQVKLFNEQLICIMANAASYRFGLSPVQVLLETVRADLAATEKAMNLVKDVPPPHLLHLKGATEQTLKKARTQYETEVAGQRELLFLGWNDEVKVFPLMFSLKDNQFLEWQTYLARKICAVFQISPQAIGITFDINKATAEVQQDITEDAGIIPLLLLIEEYWNRELVADFAKVDRDGRPLIDQLNLCVLFPEISEIARIRHAERVLKMAVDGMAGLPILTPNIAMRMLGEKDIPGGNTLWVMTTQGPMPWLSYDGATGFYGSFATAGDLGAQSPVGGVDEDTQQPENVSHQKPNRSQPDEFVGNESSGNGAPPDSGTGGNGASQSAPVASSGQSTAQPAPQAQEAAKALRALAFRDTRKPGKAWNPAQQRVPVTAIAASAPPTAREAARRTLEATARRIFEEALPEKQETT